MIKKLKYIYTKNLSKNVFLYVPRMNLSSTMLRYFGSTLKAYGQWVCWFLWMFTPKLVFLTDLTYSMSLFNQLYSFSTMSVLRYVYWILIAFQQWKACLKDINLMMGKCLYCFCILFVCLFFCLDFLVFLNWRNGLVRRSWSNVPIFFIKQPSFVTGFVTWPPKHSGHDDTV